MKGKILDYSIQESKGIISGDDGQRYSFENKEWKSSELPKVNQVVDFEVDEKNAKGIYLLQTDSILKQKKSATISMENKIGIGICLLLIILYPIIDIMAWWGWYYDINRSILSHSLCLFAWLATLTSAYLFFSNASKSFIELNTVFVGLLVTYILYDHSSLFENLLRLKITNIGALTIFILVICLIVIGFKEKKNE